MKKQSVAIKALLCAVVIILTCLVQIFLGKQTGLTNKSEDVHPPLFDTPSYVELYDGNTLNLELVAKENCHLGSMDVVLVNTDSVGKGIIKFSLTDASGSEIWSVAMPEMDVAIGEWTAIGSSDFYMEEGKEYKLSITADGCSPYFIKTQKNATNKVMPFYEKVEGADTGISLGTSLISDKPLTYADVFYHSRIISVLVGASFICLIIFGYGKCVMKLRKLPELDLIEAFGSDIFLCVLFITLCRSQVCRKGLRC